jgi:hypothetical protein
MIEQIKDADAKKSIARKILEALTDWFEVKESREKYIAESLGRRKPMPDICHVLELIKPAGAFRV